MKKAIALVLMLVMTLTLLCACNADQNKGREINSVNHRGYNKVAPENTLSAYRLSKEHGFTMVETDVSFTKDGVPVLLHDDSVNRTSDGKGNIWDLTFEEVRKLDFGKKKKKYAGEQIPSFREFIDLCVELQLYPYIEVKSDSSLSGLSGDERMSVLLQRMTLLVDIVDNADIDVTWISFDIDILTILAALVPEGRFGYIMNKVDQDKVDRAAALKTDSNRVFIDANYYRLTNKAIKRCKDAGIPLEVWTVDAAMFIRNIDPYITGVTSNNKNASEICN